MTRTECRSEILVFKVSCENYQRLILNNDNPLPYETRIRLIDTTKSRLNQTYGKLEKYIDVFGQGVSYIDALSDGGASEIVGHLSFVISNMDRIIGRLDAMTDKEFSLALKASQSKTANHLSQDHIHKQYWGFMFNKIWDWIQKYVLQILLVGIIIGVAVAYISHRFGLNK